MIHKIMEMWAVHYELYYGIVMFALILITLWIGSLKSVRWEPYAIMPMLFISMIWPIGIPIVILLFIFVGLSQLFDKVNKGSGDWWCETDASLAHHK